MHLNNSVYYLLKIQKQIMTFFVVVTYITKEIEADNQPVKLLLKCVHFSCVIFLMIWGRQMESFRQ